MSDLATAAEVANRIDKASRQSDGSYRMPCPACGSENPTILSVRDRDGGGVWVDCWRGTCKWQDILRALQEATGLRLLREKGQRRPRKVKRFQPPQSQAKPPKSQGKGVKQQDEAEKQRLCDELRRASSQGPFPDDHPSMRYVLTKEAHACWASGVPLPIPYVPVKGLPSQLRSLVDKGQGAVGCLLGSFRLKPGGDPQGVQRVILNAQGLPVSKLSLGKQGGLVWLGDDPSCEGSLYLVEGILDAIRVLFLLEGQQGRVACTAGSLSNLVGKVEGLLPTLQQFDRIVLIPDGDVAEDVVEAIEGKLWDKGLRVDTIAIEKKKEDPASVSTDWLQGRLLDDPEPIQEAVDPGMAAVDPVPDPEPSQRSAEQAVEAAAAVDPVPTQQESKLTLAQWQAVDPQGLSWMDGMRVPGRHRCDCCYRQSSELRFVFVGDDQQQVGWCPWCIQQGSIQYVAQVQPAAATQ